MFCTFDGGRKREIASWLWLRMGESERAREREREREGYLEREIERHEVGEMCVGLYKGQR